MNVRALALSVGILVWGVALPLAAAPCTGRYVVTTSAPVVPAGEEIRDAIVIGRHEINLSFACGPSPARQRGRRGASRLKACREGRGRLRLRFTNDCETVDGTLVLARQRTTLQARRSRCGDGIVDRLGGEVCDPGEPTTGSRCSTDCRQCAHDGRFSSTWTGIVAHVLIGHRCQQCHDATAIGSLDLRPAHAHANLVGAATNDGAPPFYVAPGDHATSLLWLKLAKATRGGLDDIDGAGMPIGDPPLPDALLEAVARWIDAGAPLAGTVPGADALAPMCSPS